MRIMTRLTSRVHMGLPAGVKMMGRFLSMTSMISGLLIWKRVRTAPLPTVLVGPIRSHCVIRTSILHLREVDLGGAFLEEDRTLLMHRKLFGFLHSTM